MSDRSYRAWTVRSTALIMFVSALAVNVFAFGFEDSAVMVPEPARGTTISFTNVSEEVGLSGLTGSFFSWGDIDNDGHQDLLIDGRRLMRNTGPPLYRFEDITGAAMAGSRSNSGVFADYDNDGALDIFCGGGLFSNDHPTVPDVLWRNLGGGVLEDATYGAGGLSDTFPTSSGGWADMDRNGFVDLYMVNYENGSYQGYPDHFWTNDGGGRFTNMSHLVQMNGSIPPYQGRGVSWADFDNDGWQDAYVSNYRIMRNFLFRNQKGDRFIEAASELGIEGHASNHPVTRDGPYYGHSLGSSWGDLDNDGDLDLWVTNLAHKDPWRGPICDDSYLFENLGAEQGYRFRDRREGSGIEVKTIPGSLGGGDELMVSSSLADYDNDGDLDLFIPQIYGDIGYAYSLLYRNDGAFTFTEVGEEVGVRVWNTYGSAWCDYNEDGWIDLITGGGVWEPSSSSTKGYMVHLFRNEGAQSGSGNEWLEVSLEGRTSNRAAVGARVTCRMDWDGDGAAERTVIREVQGGQGAHGQQDSMVLHLGLGEVKGPVDLEVRWPLGRSTVLKDIPSNSLHRLIEPDDPVQVSLNLDEPYQTSEGTVAGFGIRNTCAHPLFDLELLLVLENGGGPAFTKVMLDGPLQPGEALSSFALLEGARWDEGSILTIEVSRSFPPMTSAQRESLTHPVRSRSPPVAILTGPDKATVGETVRFSGVRSYDEDGSIAKYLFDAGDGTGQLELQAPDFDHTFMGAGGFLASLVVVDDMGLTSVEASYLRIYVEESELVPPTAVIVKISPSTSLVGEELLFEGKGIPAKGSTIVAYRWSSSLDGFLSEERYFRTGSLSAGEHTIYLTVTDSNGLISSPAVAVVNVNKAALPALRVSIERPLNGSEVKGILKARGSSAPADVVERVEVRLDGGEWVRTSDHLLPGWEVSLDVSSLRPGPHTLEARASAGQYTSPVVNVTFFVEGGGPMDDGTARERGPDVTLGMTAGPLMAIVIIAATAAAAMVVVMKARRSGKVEGLDRPEDIIGAIVLEEVDAAAERESL